MKQFIKFFGVDNNTKILDIGGGMLNWVFINEKPQVTILNLNVPSNFEHRSGNLLWIKGNALDIPCQDKSFDIAYANSVIEHLSSFENQKIFAREISRISENIYVQTPNRYFFIEPHLVTPFTHYLPKRLQRYLLRNFTVWGIVSRPSQEDIIRFLKEVRLLTYSELKILFPDCEIIKERFCFLTKSFIVVRKNHFL